MTAIFHEQSDLLHLPSDELIGVCQKSLGVPSQEEIQEKKTVTLGDMHGNTLNFVHKLMAFKVLVEPEGEEKGACYQELVAAYGALSTRPPHQPAWYEKQSYESNKEFGARKRAHKRELAQYKKDSAQRNKSIPLFLKALGKMTCNPAVDLDLIGDLVGDRGANDLLTLHLLKKLKKAGVNYVINISNHDIAFIAEYEKSVGASGINHVMGSSNALFSYMRESKEHAAEVKDLYENVYRNHLVAFACQYDSTEKSLNITTHTPITMMSVFAAAEYYEIDASIVVKAEDSLEDFMGLVNAVNAKFQADIQTGKITKQGKPLSDANLMSYPVTEGRKDWRTGRYIPILSTPENVLPQIVWNRDVSDDEQKEHADKVAKLCGKWGINEITFTHGHTGPMCYGSPKRHLNIDSNFAKAWGDKRYTTGDFCVTVAGPLVTLPELTIVAEAEAVDPEESGKKAKDSEHKEGASSNVGDLESGGKKENPLAKTGRGRSIAETWVGTAGLALTAAGATGCILFLPEIIQGGLALSSNPLALIAVIALAVGAAAFGVGAISLGARRKAPVFFASCSKESKSEKDLDKSNCS